MAGAASGRSPTTSTSSIPATAVRAPRPAGSQVEEDRLDFGEARYDLCVAVGTLDTVNDLPLALQLIGRSLRAGRAADRRDCRRQQPCRRLRASLHRGRPRGQAGSLRASTRGSTPASLAQLLAAAGFAMPVVDVDRVTLRYARLRRARSATCGPWAATVGAGANVRRRLDQDPARALPATPFARAGDDGRDRGSRGNPPFSRLEANNRGKRRINLVTPINS